LTTSTLLKDYLNSQRILFDLSEPIHINTFYNMASFGLGKATTANAPIIEQDNMDASTPWMAASEGNLALLQSSLQQLNFPLTAADENGYTLLHAAASYNHLGMVQFLISNGADIHAVDKDGDSVLHYAGNIASAKMLVEVGQANLARTNAQGKTALQAKQEELVEIMHDEDMDEDDEDVDLLKDVVEYLASLSR
jgi:ankyrin repeat protein